MRKKVFSAALGFCLLATLTAATAFAQGLAEPSLRATIPFEFTVRGKALPAGDYVIKRFTDDSSNLLVISNVKNHEHAVFETENVKVGATPKKGEIVFHRYGESYFLSEVFAGGEDMGNELPPSRQERRLRRDLASNKTETETVAVAAY